MAEANQPEYIIYPKEYKSFTTGELSQLVNEERKKCFA